MRIPVRSFHSLPIQGGEAPQRDFIDLVQKAEDTEPTFCQLNKSKVGIAAGDEVCHKKCSKLGRIDHR
jgi:hypothetical protein